MTKVCKCFSRGCGKNPFRIFLNHPAWRRHQLEDLKAERFGSLDHSDQPVGVSPVAIDKAVECEVLTSTLLGPDPVPVSILQASAFHNTTQSQAHTGLQMAPAPSH
ncbi:hypothetical protein K439DRAFT_1618515 [Ramaria rubella]|nr:hypothetical protein K439DRAFT_1618515 [Ramaria rubella]